MAGGYHIGHTALGQENRSSGLLTQNLVTKSMATINSILFRGPSATALLSRGGEGANRDKVEVVVEVVAGGKECGECEKCPTGLEQGPATEGEREKGLPEQVRGSVLSNPLGNPF